MAITPDLRWRDETGVVHSLKTETVQVRSPAGDRHESRWACRCGLRTFTKKFPPSFLDNKVTCVGCLALE